MTWSDKFESDFIRKTTPEFYARLFRCHLDAKAFFALGAEFLERHPSETLSDEQALHLVTVGLFVHRPDLVSTILVNNARKLSRSQFLRLFDCLLESLEVQSKEAIDALYEIGRIAPEVTSELNELIATYDELKNDIEKAAWHALGRLRSAS